MVKKGEDPIYQQLRDRVNAGFESMEEEIEYFLDMHYLSRTVHLECLHNDWTVFRNKINDTIDEQIGIMLIQRRWGLDIVWKPCNYCNINGGTEITKETDNATSYRCNLCSKGWGELKRTPREKPKPEPMFKPVERRKKRKHGRMRVGALRRGAKKKTDSDS